MRPSGRVRWWLDEVTETLPETPRARSLGRQDEDWPGHRLGRQVDVRLTVEVGYQAVRSYSIASALQPGRLAITTEVVWPAAEAPLGYVCEPTGFVEGVPTLLVEKGHEPERVRTERFGPTGS